MLAPIDSAGMGVPGTSVSVDLPVTDGHAYSWTVAETDGTTWSSAAGPSDFISDTTPPLNPTVTSMDFPTAGGGLQSPLGVGGAVVPPNDNGSLVISGQSFGWGTHTLHAQAEDNASNVSAVTQYSFYVAQSPELSPKLNLQSEPIGVIADGSGSTGLWPITSCTYDFGDHTPPDTMSDCNLTDFHDYAKLGTYPVTLTITDKYGNQKSVTKDYTTPEISKGTLYHAVLNSTTWVSGWASPTGSTNLAQATITALPDGSTHLLAVDSNGIPENTVRHATGSWVDGWGQITQTAHVIRAANVSIAGMPNGEIQIIEVSAI